VNYFTKLKKLEIKPKTIDDLILRGPNVCDSEEIAELYKASFPEHILVKRGVLSDSRKIKEQLYLENKKWVVADLDEKIVGCSTLEASEWNAAAELERIVVAKNMRGNGIAKEMCKTLIEDVAQPIGVKYVFAHARGPEYAMQKTLQNLGFKIGGIMPVFYVNHDGRDIRENFVYMFRFLNEGENEVESIDNLIPVAKKFQELIERQ
jgi:N-acetylglutamate synthase-like GNAT family acetyltransferase